MLNNSVTTNLTALYANKNNPSILGRDEELSMLFLTLMRYEKPNAILTGEPGVDKTSIVHQLAYLIANNLAPEKLNGFQVIEVNTNALIAGPGYRGVIEEKFENLIRESLNKGKVILFIDEFHTAEHLGEMSNGQTPGLGNTLKPYLTRPDFRVIGATTNAEYASINDKALLRRFYTIQVPEPTDAAIRLIIESCLKKYGKGIAFKKSVVDKILELSKSLSGFNPDKAKDITDVICSYANMTGATQVDDVFISLTFDKFFLGLVSAETETKKAEFID